MTAHLVFRSDCKTAKVIWEFQPPLPVLIFFLYSSAPKRDGSDIWERAYLPFFRWNLMKWIVFKLVWEYLKRRFRVYRWVGSTLNYQYQEYQFNLFSLCSGFPLMLLFPKTDSFLQSCTFASHIEYVKN